MADAAPTNTKLATLLCSLVTQVADLAAVVSTGTSATTSSVSFTLTPRQVKPDTVINYAVKQGTLQREAGTKSLCTLFNLTSEHLAVFINKLMSRSKVQGWDKGTNDLLTFTTSAEKDIDLLSQYDLLTSKTITDQTQDLIEWKRSFRLFVFFVAMPSII